jgi:hypothetical protein
MAEKCKHGLDARFCGDCRRAKESEPLDMAAVQFTKAGAPAIVLRQPDAGTAVALVLEGTSGCILTIDRNDLQHMVRAEEPTSLLERFHDVALVLGHLMHPQRALTVRELSEEGPSRCYACKTEISLSKGSLGCTQCESYVCRCGRCLCGYTGRNYRGEVFTQPPLPIPREERLEFVRVVRLCERGA